MRLEETMMKHLKTLGSSMLALSLPLSGMAFHGGDHFDHGFYVGGAAGVSRLSGDIEQTLFGITHIVLTNITIGTGYLDTSFDAETTRAMGQIQLGYAIAWDWLFVGLEVSLNGSQLHLEQHSQAFGDSYGPTEPPFFDSYDAVRTTITSDADIELNNFEPVADLKLGFNLHNKTYLYGRVGAAFNTIEVHDSITYTQAFFDYFDSAHLNIPQGFRTSESESKVGLRVGVGVEHKFFDQVSVALDYVHTEYGSVSVSHFEDTIIAFSSIESSEFQFGVSDDVDVRRDVVTLGVNYYFR